MSRPPLAAVLFAAAVAISASPAGAIIDPNFTPAVLVKQSPTIRVLTLAPGKAADSWQCQDIETLAGKKPPPDAPPTVTLAGCEQDQAETARKLLADAAAARQQAILFVAQTDKGEHGYLHVGGAWLEVRSEPACPGQYAVPRISRKMSGTWAGGTQTLIRLARRLLADPASGVPVSVGVSWMHETPLLGKVDRVAGMEAVEFAGDKSACLFVASTQGDRIYRAKQNDEAFEDVTAAMKLDTRSPHFTWLDLDGDGQPELVSWDGRAIHARKLSGEGTFQPLGERLELDGDCLGLTACSSPGKGTPAVLVSTANLPVLLWRDESGKWRQTSLPGGDAKAQAGPPACACIVADLDSDGFFDVLQPGAKAGLLWRGRADGFADPQACAVIADAPAVTAVADFTQDGLLDIFVSGKKANELWENDGKGGFRPVARSAGSINYKCPPGAARCIATDRVSPAALKAEGAKTLAATGFDKLQRETARTMDKSGLDGFAVFRPSASALLAARRVGTEQALLKPAPAGDWQDRVFVRMFFDPFTAPPPPPDWAAAAFDDAAWPLRRGPFQIDMPDDLPPDRTAGNMSNVHFDALQYIGTGIHSAFYRARFVVDDPAGAGLTLRLVYRGGARAFVNGREVARGNLPRGELAPDAAGEDYQAEAYQNASLRDRRLGPVKIPAEALVKGANVLAVEIRASDLHPIVLKKEFSRSWNALHDRECQWRHGYLAGLELRATCPAGSELTRPAGVQVWPADIHHRVGSAEFSPPGEPTRPARIVAARNGTFSAQLVVGTDRELTGLTATVSELKQAAGAGTLPAGCAKVLYMSPFPADQFGLNLGDERGLDASFPTAAELAKLRTNRGASKPCIFDQISPAAPAGMPAGTCQPVWITLRIPADAAPGTYSGTIEVKANNMAAVRTPLQVEVMNWRLPAPAKFQTLVGLEQNPYAVAKHYGVKPWSDEHLKLLGPSFEQLARIGANWLNVPVLRGTEFGNRDDSMVRWIRKADGSFAFDFATLDKYLDLATKHIGRPRVVMFAIMHGQPSDTRGPGEVMVRDEKAGRDAPWAVGLSGANKAEVERAWLAFVRAVQGHMKAKGLEQAMAFGLPLDGEPEPALRELMTKSFPTISWAAAPHQIGCPGFAAPQYKFIGTVRYFNNWPAFRMDQGWRNPVAHLTIPRIDSSVQSLVTVSHPFAFRALVDHSLALGRQGFFRVGADEWAGAHYDGMKVPTWIVGMPVLFTLWPGPDGAQSSARFEALLEGVQEGEVRIYLEKAIASGRLPRDLAQRTQAVLNSHFQETSFFQNKLCIFELEQYHYRWQDRSRALFQAAADAAKALGQ